LGLKAVLLPMHPGNDDGDNDDGDNDDGDNIRNFPGI
jgi:hypothetical protein